MPSRFTMTILTSLIKSDEARRRAARRVRALAPQADQDQLAWPEARRRVLQVSIRSTCRQLGQVEGEE